MTQPLSFQDVIMQLQAFWAARGCIIWQPYYTQVGAGTGNPATFLRVLGPEPWKVAYVEPSIRPDDGRYGDNPNRMQMHYQFQVILKPDPGDPQGLYLESLEAIGIDRRQHDIRFVEDNWESPALGAWGLGWEVWLDGQEITQFTYFQQAGGQVLPVPSVEITYGLERIVMALQDASSVWEIEWGNGFKYGDALLQSEIEHCRYYFEIADVDRLAKVFETYESESLNALAQTPPLVLPAYDYVLKCSHLFNVLDTRGAVGVVERAKYFKRMQTLAAKVAAAYADQRRALEYPLLPEGWSVDVETGALTIQTLSADSSSLNLERGMGGEVAYPTEPASFLLEIGVEELPVADLDWVGSYFEEGAMRERFEDLRLDFASIKVGATPRRIVVLVEGLSPHQTAEEIEVWGPPARVAFDDRGRPTQAAKGFAQKNGVDVSALERRIRNGGEYAVVIVRDEGRPTPELLSSIIPSWIETSCYGRKLMRWNLSGAEFPRPIRWIVALYGKAVVPVTFAGIQSGRTTRGTRLEGSPEVRIKDAKNYPDTIREHGVIIEQNKRHNAIEEQITARAKQVGGTLKGYEALTLLDEVTNLVEQPTALLGRFGQEFLDLPAPVLTTVMKKHQRYFAVEDKKGKLLPVFIAVRNGDDQHLDSVIEGNEHVIRARFADARFFFREDTKKKLADFLGDLKTLTFQEQLGSYYDKATRLEGLAARIGGMLGLADGDLDTAIRAARLAKADLATHMVVEMTSLQGIMGREYALLSGESPAVADAIAEHYQPRQTGDVLPESWPGIVVALADRLDSLVGLLALGMAPTGSADPYGLRRAALGIVQIVMGKRISLDLRQVIDWVAQAQPVEVASDAHAAVLDFIAGRLRVVLKETYRHDVVEAALGAASHDPYRASVYADQFSRHVAREDWPPILDAYARCVRITRDQPQQYTLKPDAFKEPVERKLYQAYQKAAKAIGGDPDVDVFVAAFEPLVGPISAFFAPAAEGGVMVMDQDRAVRENRLALLQHIVALGAGVADFSQLEGF